MAHMGPFSSVESLNILVMIMSKDCSYLLHLKRHRRWIRFFSNITIDSFNYWLWRTLTAFLLLYPSLRLALTMHPFAMDPVVLTRSIFSTDSGSVPTQVFASSSNLQLLRAGRQNARSSLERTHYFDEDLTQSKISGVIHQSRANARLLNLKWRYALHSDIYTCTPFDIS